MEAISGGSQPGPERNARLFAAIWLPPDVGVHLSACLNATWGLDRDEPAAAGSAHARLRRTHADTWHITLAFAGEAPLSRTLGRFLVPGDLPGGSLQLAGAGTFGPAVWVGVLHDGWLQAAAEAMQNRLSVADRRFRAHVTVGRVRGPGREPQRVAQAAAVPLHQWRGPTWTPTEVVLVESLLGPNPHYPVVGRIPLG